MLKNSHQIISLWWKMNEGEVENAYTAFTLIVCLVMAKGVSSSGRHQLSYHPGEDVMIFSRVSIKS